MVPTHANTTLNMAIAQLAKVLTCSLPLPPPLLLLHSSRSRRPATMASPTHQPRCPPTSASKTTSPRHSGWYVFFYFATHLSIHPIHYTHRVFFLSLRHSPFRSSLYSLAYSTFLFLSINPSLFVFPNTMFFFFVNIFFSLLSFLVTSRNTNRFSFSYLSSLCHQ